MRNVLFPPLFLILVAARLTAADPGWKSKPADQWTAEEAKQLLARSPWSKLVGGTLTRRLTEDQLREAGQMGQPQGIGYDGVDPKGSGPKVSPNIFTGPGGDDHGTRAVAQPLTLRVRWESALPVRIAELKAQEIEPPTMEGDGYRIAVYGIPGSDIKGDPKQLGEPLKAFAALKREGKKDVKPVSVEVFRQERGYVVVYLFPLSAEITLKDGVVLFDARIGRIVASQNFLLSEMQFMGQLAL